MVVKCVIWSIKFYQRWISVWLLPHCRFYPSCSAYCITALERFGIWTGVVLSVRRLLRCHPLVPGGYDPVPEKIKEVEPA